MNENLIEYKNVSVSHQDLVVLKGVNLQVSKGELVYFVGRVGSGKSSLLKSLYCETSISDGTATIFDYDLTCIKNKHIPYLRRKIGIVFQDFKLLTDRTVYKNLEFVLRATDTKSQSRINSRIEEVLSFVGMATKGYKMPHELSGGEQQRVVVARALLNKPDVLIADEPTGNLDAKTASEVMDIINQIKDEGTTVLFATHNLKLLKKYPGRIFYVNNSRISEVSIDDIHLIQDKDDDF